MIKQIKSYWFPVFFVLVIMAEMIFHAFMIAFNIKETSGQLQYLFMVIFSISFFILIDDFGKIKRGFNNKRLITYLVLLVILYWITQFFYNTQRNPNYITYLLTFGVKCIPAVIVGAHFMRNPTMYKIDKILPFVILPVGLILGVMGYEVAMSNSLVGRGDDDDGSGLNYQIFAYYMAELYAYSAYYVFYSSARYKSKYRILRLLVFFAMLFFAAVCMLSGGRGAMVFIIVVSAYIVYSLNKTKRMSRIQLLIAIIAIGLIFAYIFTTLDISNSLGYNRVINNLTIDEERDELSAKALYSIKNSIIIGHGLGSVWWEVGFYTHNMFSDLLVETGIFGTCIVGCVLWRMTYRLLKMSYNNNSFFFVLFMYFRILLTTMLSGYWFGAYQLWIVYGMVMVLTESKFKEILKDLKKVQIGTEIKILK